MAEKNPPQGGPRSPPGAEEKNSTGENSSSPKKVVSISRNLQIDDCRNVRTGGDSLSLPGDSFFSLPPNLERSLRITFRMQGQFGQKLEQSVEVAEGDFNKAVSEGEPVRHAELRALGELRTVRRSILFNTVVLIAAIAGAAFAGVTLL